MGKNEKGKKRKEEEKKKKKNKKKKKKMKKKKKRKETDEEKEETNDGEVVLTDFQTKAIGAGDHLKFHLFSLVNLCVPLLIFIR